MNVGPLFTDKFQCNGRGPELERVHWAYDGKVLRAIDFHIEDENGPNLRYVFFISMQVFMCTPEEVINYATMSELWSENRQAGIFCLGKSPWLKSFSQHHLSKCDHYQLLFYDQLFDV